MGKERYVFPAIDILTGIVFLIVLTVAIKWFIDLVHGDADCVMDYMVFLIGSHFGLLVFLGSVQSFLGDEENCYAWLVIPLYLIIIIALIVILMCLGVDCDSSHNHSFYGIPEFLPY